MAKIIELSGTPGAGKSTLYNNLVNSWSPHNTWKPAHHLYPKLKQPTNGFKGMVAYILKKYIKGKNSLDLNAMRDAGDRFANEHQAYLDACWLNIALRQKQTFNGLDLRFKKAGFLYTTIQQVQIIYESKLAEYGLLDEGLIHKVTGGALYNSNNAAEEKEELMTMLENTPLPDAFIFLYSDPDETTKRLVQRKRVINMHKSLSAEEIHLITKKTEERMQIANAFLEKKGVPVLYLDAKLTLDDKMQKLQAFFNALK